VVKKRYITYTEFGELMDRFVNKIRSHISTDSVKCVYGPPRGGLPIATHVSHHLELELIVTFTMTQQSTPILLVDDVCDSGRTIQQLLELRSNCIVATLFKKPRSIIEPNIYLEEVNDDTWLVFPWEKDDNPDKDYFL